MEEKNDKFDFLDLETRKELVRKYNSENQKEKEEAITSFLEALDGYVYYYVHHHFKGYINIIEDLAQSGRVAIIEHIPDYNPEYRLTTFFGNHIQNALQDVVNSENGETHYYAESKNTLVKKIRSLGLDIENVDEQTLALHMGMTQSRVHSILEKTLNKKRVELVEEDGETATEYYASPEDAFIKKEKEREYLDCMNELEPYECIVMYMHCGYPLKSWNPNARVYSIPEIQKIFDHQHIDENATNLYRSARRHLVDIFKRHGIAVRKNSYQIARDEVGFKFFDEEEATAFFDALDDSDDIMDALDFDADVSVSVPEKIGNIEDVISPSKKR